MSQTITFPIFLRVFWSTLWRVTLIGAMFNAAVSNVIPPGEIEQIVTQRIEADIQKKFDEADTEKDSIARLERTIKISEEMSYIEVYEKAMRYAQETIRERGLLRWTYLRDMLITLLPTIFATVIAVSIVLEKSWRRFQLSVRDANGNVRRTLWRPTLIFSAVQYGPLFCISGAFYYMPWFTSSWWAFMIWSLIGLMIYTAGMYLALRWPYRSFRLQIDPVTVMEQAA